MFGHFFKGWETRRQRRLWEQALQQKADYPEGRFHGRGLVFCAGGQRLFTNLFVNLCVLRRLLHCRLPVEVWYFGEKEITPGMAALLEPFDVRLINGEKKTPVLPKGFDRGFALKTLAIEYSSFEEVLFLDTESYPMRDPSFLFEEPSYAWSGAMFWADIWETVPDAVFWNILGLDHVDELEWESGQMVLHKRKCWKALQLVGHLSRHFDFYYHLTYGDKMTYYAAWKAAGQGYAMGSFPPKLHSSSSERKMLDQFDQEGGLLFQHRVMCDWSLTLPEPDDAEWLPFHHREACLSFLEELKSKWPEDASSSRAAGESPMKKNKGKAGLYKSRNYLSTPENGLLSGPCSDKWEATACQVWRSPYLKGTDLFLKGLSGLVADGKKEGAAILRFFGVLIFLDPRLIPLLPDEQEMQGTGLGNVWNKLRALIVLLGQNRKGSARLCLKGSLDAKAASFSLPPGEKEIAACLAELTGTGWKQFLHISGIPVPSDPADGQAIVASRNLEPSGKRVLVLTPIKNAADQAGSYFQRLSGLNYPPELLSLGLFESDSKDGTEHVFPEHLERWQKENGWRRSRFWKEDFHFEIPEGLTRWHLHVQGKRREILAKSRNRLTALALDDEDWVLWLDSDVTEYPADIIQQLLSYRKDILQPHCVLEYGQRTFDNNAWRNNRSLGLSDMRGKEILAPLDAVGGTMLFIRADLFRRGLVFPETPYVRKDGSTVQGPPWDPQNPGEIETEGLGLMAADMGVTCWGLPELEILHGKM